MRSFLLTIALIAAPGLASAARCAQITSDPLAGFAALDAMIYLDLPDPETTRAVTTVENTFVSQVVAGEIDSFTKRWCQIGIRHFIVDFEVPMMDDSVAAQITRVVYEWNSAEDPVGWQISQMGARFRCARGDDPFAPVCP